MKLRLRASKLCCVTATQAKARMRIAALMTRAKPLLGQKTTSVNPKVPGAVKRANQLVLRRRIIREIHCKQKNIEKFIGCGNTRNKAKTCQRGVKLAFQATRPVKRSGVSSQNNGHDHGDARREDEIRKVKKVKNKKKVRRKKRLKRANVIAAVDERSTCCSK